MFELPAKFLERMKDELGERFDDFVRSYGRAPYKAVRVNTLKISVEKFKELSPFELSPVPHEPCGFYVTDEKAGKTVHHAAGLYYVQEPSAMSAAPLLDVKAGEKVLDMCSAPGGKGTQMAQRMCGEGVIVLNEINYPRAKILSQNVERLGITNAVVTCCTPEMIAKSYVNYFDKVLVDAPCSGEGMFLKEPNAIREWSEDNVRLCAERQKNILECAQSVLRGGGLLVYSTCTFSPDEDELQIKSFLERHGNFELITEKKLLPHEFKGEGHFVALLRKNGGETGECTPFKINTHDSKKLNEYRSFENKFLKVKFDRLHIAGNTLYSIPEACPAVAEKGALLRAGVQLGEIISDRFEPSHSLAMCLNGGDAQSIDLDEAAAIKYLKGLTFECDPDISGWALVTFCGYPLGWCKCVQGTAKNHLPKGLRI